MRIGLIGCGTIGIFLLENLKEEYQITAVFDSREKSTLKMKALSDKYHFKVYQEIESFLNSEIDLVIESANIKVVKAYATKIIQKKDLLMISVGALADQWLYEKLKTQAKLNSTKIYLPAGAIGGLELIRAANTIGGLDSVSLITRKPAAALSDESFIGEKMLFEGSARDAIEKFPENTNVAITLSLAGVGVDQTRVKVIADSTVTKNQHIIQAQGEFGKASFCIENNPSPTNSKTSYLTALSIFATLKSLNEQIIIG